MPLPIEPSLVLTVSFIALSLAVASFMAIWSKRHKLVAAWTAITGGLAYAGFFQNYDLPPRMLLVILPGLVAITIFAWRSNLHSSPLKLIVGLQAFRIPVELLIHRAVSEGVAPPQLTWTGMNWDVASGVLALILLPFANRLPKAALHLFNFVGAALLINVVVVALLSLPTTLQRITPDNIWVAYFPFAWLPLIHVTCAWAGHVVLLRRLTYKDSSPA